MADQELRQHLEEIRAELAQLSRDGEYEQLVSASLEPDASDYVVRLLARSSDLTDDQVAEYLDDLGADESGTSDSRRAEIRQAFARARAEQQGTSLPAAGTTVELRDE